MEIQHTRGFCRSPVFGSCSLHSTCSACSGTCSTGSTEAIGQNKCHQRGKTQTKPVSCTMPTLCVAGGACTDPAASTILCKGKRWLQGRDSAFVANGPSEETSCAQWGSWDSALGQTLGSVILAMDSQFSEPSSPVLTNCFIWEKGTSTFLPWPKPMEGKLMLVNLNCYFIAYPVP